MLDSFPHGGGMTTMDALWMGIPVIGLVTPEKAGGRIIESICQPLGLEQWVARTPEEYRAIALKWADRYQQLADIRQHLRGKVTDVYGRFTGDVEKAYRKIWQRWCEVGSEP